MKGTTFNDILKTIETFPEDQRESLIKIIRNRLIEERRERLARSIKEAREEYARGEVRHGTVDDLMRGLSE